jgi:hypothetical protein
MENHGEALGIGGPPKPWYSGLPPKKITLFFWLTGDGQETLGK